ncbi:MAG: hypothetical protein Q8N55_00855 [bacterium]|nr:hypothetical protein [bacterium]
MNNNNFLKEKLLNKIKEGRVKMKPKAFFAFKIIAASLSLLACFFLIIYLLSFASFCSRANGLGLLNRFGLAGFPRVFFALPWLLILLCLLLLLIFEVIAKKFALVWKKPLFYSLLALVLLSFIFSLAVSKVDFHARLFYRAQDQSLPLIGGFYRNLPCKQPKQVHFGKLIEKEENGFLLQTETGEVLEILLNQETRFNFNEKVKVGEELAFILEGDSIAVVGEKDDGQIEAFGIIKLPINFKVPPCGLINLRVKPLDKP